MYSLDFPNMLNSTTTRVIKDHAASLSNLILLLKSDRNSLLGDPYFGTNLKNFLFNQNNIVLRDVIVDEIYTAIKTFLPQISVERKNISVTSDRDSVYVNIKALNLLDYTLDSYNLNLINAEELN